MRLVEGVGVRVGGREGRGRGWGGEREVGGVGREWGGELVEEGVGGGRREKESKGVGRGGGRG